MTSPFQSIISTPEVLGRQNEHDERNSFSELLAEDTRAVELAAIDVSPKEIRLPTSTEWDSLFKLHETKTVAGSSAPAAPERKPLSGGTYTPAEALALLNSHFFVGKNNLNFPHQR